MLLSIAQRFHVLRRIIVIEVLSIWVSRAAETCSRRRTRSPSPWLASDDSPEALAPLHQADPRVKVVAISRQFFLAPPQGPLLAGLEYAQGDLICLLDRISEEEPEALVPLYNVLREMDADVAVRHPPESLRDAD